MKTEISFACLLVGLSVLPAFAEKQPFERYQSIVDRQMFGALPPGFDPTKSPNEVSKSDQKQLTQEQEKLQSAIRFSVINLTPEGDTAVGFTDNSDPKVPVHYYLKVGESRNGWTVKDADPEAATMTIAKGEIEVTLSIGGNSAQDANATSKSSPAEDRNARSPRPGALLGGGRRARRLLREQQAKEAKERADAAAAEREAERQAQAEAERAQHEAERAEQRQQLQAIQDELKRVREAKAAAKSEESAEADAANGHENN